MNFDERTLRLQNEVKWPRAFQLIYPVTAIEVESKGDELLVPFTSPNDSRNTTCFYV